MSRNLTKKEALWAFVWCVVLVFIVGPFVLYPLIYHPDFDPVVNLALLCIGLIGACYVVGASRRLEKKVEKKR